MQICQFIYLLLGVQLKRSYKQSLESSGVDLPFKPKNLHVNNCV